jgi:hypothetical protein
MPLKVSFLLSHVINIHVTFIKRGVCIENPQICDLLLNVKVLGVIQWPIRLKPQRLVVKIHVAQTVVAVLVVRLEIAVAAVAVMGAVAVQKAAAHKITDSESYVWPMSHLLAKMNC